MEQEHPLSTEQYGSVSVLSRNDLAAKLKVSRRHARLTQAEMGDRLGLTARMVRYMEAGKRGARPHVHGWSQATGLPEEWFFDAD